MDSIEKRLLECRKDILNLARKHGAYNIRIFFSRPDSEHRDEIGFLVSLETGRTLLDQGGLLTDLQTLLECPVSVFTEGGLKGNYRQRILKQAVPL
jgi:predicted nucleotidyltransferase